MKICKIYTFYVFFRNFYFFVNFANFYLIYDHNMSLGASQFLEGRIKMKMPGCEYLKTGQSTIEQLLTPDWKGLGGILNGSN